MLTFKEFIYINIFINIIINKVYKVKNINNVGFLENYIVSRGAP